VRDQDKGRKPKDLWAALKYKLLPNTSRELSNAVRQKLSAAN